MKIIFVMGPTCVGKSTFISKNFKDMTVIDLLDFQKDYMSIDEIWESYENCAEELQKHIMNDEDVILEHTLLKAIRRKYYLDAVRKVTDTPVEIYCLTADQEVLEKHYKNRTNKLANPNYINDCIKMLEIPTKEEGFFNVNIIKIKE